MLYCDCKTMTKGIIIYAIIRTYVKVFKVIVTLCICLMVYLSKPAIAIGYIERKHSIL